MSAADPVEWWRSLFVQLPFPIPPITIAVPLGQANDATPVPTVATPQPQPPQQQQTGGGRFGGKSPPKPYDQWHKPFAGPKPPPAPEHPRSPDVQLRVKVARSRASGYSPTVKVDWQTQAALEDEELMLTGVL